MNFREQLRSSMQETGTHKASEKIEYGQPLTMRTQVRTIKIERMSYDMWPDDE